MQGRTPIGGHGAHYSGARNVRPPLLTGLALSWRLARARGAETRRIGGWLDGTCRRGPARAHDRLGRRPFSDRVGESGGLEAVAITDHDTIVGVAEASDAATRAGVEPVAGVEISCRIRDRGIHLLGLFVNAGSLTLLELTARVRQERELCASTAVARAQKLRLPLDMESIRRIAGDAAIGRPHLAAALVQAGVVPDLGSAFHSYLGIGRSLFVPKRLPSSAEAIAAVQRAGGVAVVAHPGSSRVRNSLLGELADQGLDGIEVRHPKHGRQRERILLDACQRLGLLPSGGSSDFHGPGRGDSQLGEHRVPSSWYHELRKRADRP